jgi:hypothetical protein
VHVAGLQRRGRLIERLGVHGAAVRNDPGGVPVFARLDLARALERFVDSQGTQDSVKAEG